MSIYTLIDGTSPPGVARTGADYYTEALELMNLAEALAAGEHAVAPTSSLAISGLDQPCQCRLVMLARLPRQIQVPRQRFNRSLIQSDLYAFIRTRNGTRRLPNDRHQRPGAQLLMIRNPLIVPER